MTPSDRPISPRIAALQQELAHDKQQALSEFWRSMTEQGTPMVEPVPNDDRHVLITFLWRGGEDTRNVVVVGGVADQDVAEDFVHNQMTRLPDTDVWFRTYRTRNDAHFVYRFSPNDSLINAADVTNWRARESTFQADPLNLHPYQSDDDEACSIARLPGVAPQPWFDSRSTEAARRVVAHEWHSPTLDTKRTIWVHSPLNARLDDETGWLLLLFDGPSYVHESPLPAMLDDLYAADRIPPVLCVNIGLAQESHSDRDIELSCNPRFADALVNDLLPWLKQNYGFAPHADHTIVGGVSLGGLAAAYTALQYPGVFGNVMSQYGFFSWAPPSPDEPDYEWLAHQYLHSPTLPIRFVLNAGMFDRVGFDNHKQRPSLLLANRHFVDILRAKGYPVAYNEFYGGHDELNQRYTLPDMILDLFG